MQKTFPLAVFTALVSPVAAQCVDTRIQASSPSAQFGARLAADGARFLVADDGAAFVELHELAPGGASSLVETFVVPFNWPQNLDFGDGLALDGGVVAIGDPDSDLVGPDFGAVHVWEEISGNWFATQTIVPADLGFEDYFGAAVVMRGGLLAISATGQDAGAVYVFRRAGSWWTQEAKLDAPAGLAEEYAFGWQLALDGDVLAVSSRWDDGNTIDAGRVYVYERGANGWALGATLQSASPLFFGHFGFGVSLDGDLLAVGEPGANGNFSDVGRVTIHERAQGWAQVAALEADNGRPGDALGRTVDVRGARVLVGTENHRVGFVTTGAAYAFELGANGWEQTAYFMAAPALDDGRFGRAVAQVGDRDLVGSPLGAAGGSVWIVDPDSDGGGESYCPGAPNSTGDAGELFHRGSTSIGAELLSLRARRLIGGESAVLFYGPGRQQVPLADGSLCVSGPWYRFDVLPVIGGNAGRPLPWSEPPVASGPGAITAGSTWYFQMWYRDPGGVTGSNLTNGLALTFCP